MLEYPYEDVHGSGPVSTFIRGVPMKISVETVINADLNQVWDAWNNPTDIKLWNSAQDDWHTTRSSIDLREGGTFQSRMEAKDGSEGFDFEGTYTRVVPRSCIEYRMSDGREVRSNSSSGPTASS